MTQHDISPLVEDLLGDFELWQRDTGEWRCRCPFHHGADNATSFRIMPSGRWTCFSCSAFGGLEDLLVKLRGMSFRQAVEFTGNIPQRRFDISQFVLPDPKNRVRPSISYPLVKESEIAEFKRHCPKSLLNRGFSERVLFNYEIGYDNTRSRVVIPIRDVKGALVGTTLRLDWATTGSKYLHSEFEKSYHLYGLYKHVDSEQVIYLVEGHLDAVRMAQIGCNATAVMGSFLGQKQLTLLTQRVKCSGIVLAFDNDEPGRNATKQALKVLNTTRFGRNLGIARYPGKDPGELIDREQISVQHWASALLG